MLGIVIVGHGKFAEGINSVVDLVVGKKDNITTVNFLEGDSTDNLKENIIKKMSSLNCERYLIFTDMVGGSPFKVSAEIAVEKNCEVIAGTNVPMILDTIFDVDQDLKSIKNRVIKRGKEQILSFEIKQNKKKDTKESDGI